MFDGVYQSAILFWAAYFLFQWSTFVSDNGLDLDERLRFGIFIGPAAIICINLYILINTYRWDWLMVLLVVVSILLVWFWTGVYSAFPASVYFYRSAAQCFSQATFWAVVCLSTITAMLPRFIIKFTQKNLFPYDVDVVREQVRLGLFDHLLKPASSLSSSKSSARSSQSTPKSGKQNYVRGDEEDGRPIYPPSVAATATENRNSKNGSEATDYRGSMERRPSLEKTETAVRGSVDRARPSFDRLRTSMDRIRPCFEASNDFTSAALLTRMESASSAPRPSLSKSRLSYLENVPDGNEQSSPPRS